MGLTVTFKVLDRDRLDLANVSLRHVKKLLSSMADSRLMNVLVYTVIESTFLFFLFLCRIVQCSCFVCLFLSFNPNARAQK